MDDPAFLTNELDQQNFILEPAGTTFTMGLTDFEMTNHENFTINSGSNGL